MLAIRLQRTGRSGHAQFRVIVQDSRYSPKRGRVVSYLGSYDPHTKTAAINSEKTAAYLKNGAQPSDRVARLLKNEGIKLPAWVKLDEPKKREVRNPEKRRSTAPAVPSKAVEAPAAEEAATDAAATPETPATETPPEAEAPADEAKVEEAPELVESPAQTAEEKPKEKAAEN